MHRRRAGEPLHIASLAELSPFAEQRMAVPDPGPLRAEAVERVGAAVAALPIAFRLCVVLKEIVGLPVATVARILGIEPATVKTRLHRARLQLRKALAGTLPSRPAADPAYARQVCIDLLRTKQDALDRGVEAPELRDLICERCRSVFATLDQARDACAELARGRMPEGLRRRIAEA
jgi:RNA polymerase sigma-70 factor (ECF subfamily)